jgi:hypothetical protein
VVNTVNNSSETPTESGVDLDQQLVNKGQQGQQTGSADNAIASMPIEEVDAISATDEESIAPEHTDTIEEVELPGETSIEVGDRVFVESLPDTDRFGSFLVLKIEAGFAYIETYPWAIRLGDLRKEAIATDAPAESADLSGWMSPAELKALSDNLRDCQDAEDLGWLRDTYPAQALDAACKLLPADNQAQLEAWGLELNSKD